MVDNPYTEVSVSGYNNSPPPDDGSQVASNAVKWSTTKTKLSDPLKTALESMDDNVNSAFATLTTNLPIYARGQRGGLKLSNNSGDSDHDIDIAVGAVTTSDVGNILVLSSALTKRIDATWAVGTGNGGLDTGSVTTETWYHVWLIRRSDTGVVDALFSTSSTSPTMPTNYDEKAHIGAVYTDASSNILPFYQMGDWFMWTSESSLAVTSDTLSAQTAKTLTLLTPSGFDTEAQLNFYAIPDGSTSAKLIIQHPEAVVGSNVPGTGAYPIADTFPTATGGEAGGPKRQFVDSSSQVRVRSAAGSPRTTTVNIQVIAWRIIY